MWQEVIKGHQLDLRDLAEACVSSTSSLSVIHVG